jgi:hypothetical protein
MKMLIGVILVTVMFVLVGCSSSYDPAIQECADKGTFQGQTYCADCSKGVPYIVASTCVIAAAEKIAETDGSRARRICDQWEEISINTFSQGTYAKLWHISCIGIIDGKKQ